MSRKVILVFLALASVVCAQRRVDPRNTYNRLICVVPFVGAGTPADPRRPEYAPWPAAPDPNGIIAFFYEPTDDGSQAVVEFVARNRAAFQAILSDKSIKVFEKGRAARAAIEGVIRQHRKDFDMDKFGMVMP